MLWEGEFRLFDFGMPVFLRLDRDPAQVVALVEQLKAKAWAALPEVVAQG
jgi:hypothetical protein